MNQENPLTVRSIVVGLAGLCSAMIMFAWAEIVWETVNKVNELDKRVAVKDEVDRRQSEDIAQNREIISRFMGSKSSHYPYYDYNFRHSRVYGGDANTRHISSESLPIYLCADHSDILCISFGQNRCTSI